VLNEYMTRRWGEERVLCCAWLGDCDELMDIIFYGIINNKQQRIKEN
jgi:hypothetical protein